MNLSTHRIPVNYANLLLSVLEEHDGNREAALEHCRIDRDLLLNEEGLLSERQLFELVDFVQSHCRLEALGIEVGKRQTLSTWGRLGYAILASEDLNEAMSVGIKYQETTAAFFYVDSFHDDEQDLDCLVFKSRPLEPERQPFFFESTITGIFTVYRDLNNNFPELERIEIAYDKPPHWKQYEDFFQCPVIFNCAEFRCFIKPSANAPMKMADKANFIYLLKQVQERYDRLQEEDFMETLKRAIHRGEGQFLSQTEAAKILNMSSSTLARRIKEFDTTFKHISDSIRKDIAISKLIHSKDALIDIAAASGYGDLSNFNKAFHRWTGTSPAQFRKNHTGR